MTTPTITLYPDTLPAKGQANDAFDVNVNSFLNWLTLTNGPELQGLVTYTNDVANTVLATALAGNLPTLTGKAGNYIRANAAENGGEFRTPSQVKADIGLSGITNNSTSTAVTISSGGFVGINTITPDSRLDIDTGSASATAVTLQAAAATSAKLQLGLGMFSAGFPTVLGTANGLDLGTSASAPIRLFTNSVEVARIAGNALTVGGNSLTPSSGNVQNQISITGAGSIEASRESFAAVDVNRRLTDGPVVLLRKGGIQVGSISVTAVGTTYNTSSDPRLKQNITPIQGASDIVMALNPVTYTFKADGSWMDGFLTNEVQTLLPSAVTGKPDAMMDEEYEVSPAVLDEEGAVITEAVTGTRSVPDYQGLDYSRLTPILTSALQEALAKIEALTARITALEGAA